MGSRFVSLFVVGAIAVSAGAEKESWTHYGHFSNRQSIAVDGPNIIDSNTLQWQAWQDPQAPEYYVEFEGPTGCVVYDGKVYAYAKYFEPNEQSPTGFDYTASQIIAYDCNCGEILWATPVDMGIYGSCSSACIDTKHNTLLIGSGYKLFSLDADSGTVQWSTTLEKPVVNASACTALDIPYARAFITDYDGFGSSGKLYCINLDANEPNNPYQQGQIVWSDSLGATSGNSPAYKDGVVYVASLSATDSFYGSIHAYDAAADEAVKLWQSSDPNFEGFSGGVTVTKEGYLYAANYDWSEESEDNSALCKIDCNDGSIVWITQTERTNAMPVVVGDKIYMCGGIADDSPWFVGSRAKVEAYHDLGSSVVKLWETDPNIVVGGWTNQGVYANGKLYVGAIPADGDYFGAYTDLYVLDVTLASDDPNFVMGHFLGCGNSPAVTCNSLYSMGYDGLFKFGQPARLGDITGDGTVDLLDLAKMTEKWLFDGAVGIERSDLSLDGKVDMVDFSLLADR